MDKPKYLELSPEDLAKVNTNRSKKEGLAIDYEQLFIAEFGKHYGWGGVQAILQNEIEGDTAAWLLTAARKIDKRYFYDNAQATLIGTGSAKSKKPGAEFKKLMRSVERDMKADI